MEFESRILYPALSEIADAAKHVAKAIPELLWPTTCVICDKPGEILCKDCMQELPFIDRWRACSSCGAPMCAMQCTECNATALRGFEISKLPFDDAAQALALTDDVFRMIVAYKDGGEMRLSEVLAKMMLSYLEPHLAASLGKSGALTYVPASRDALQRRGFDHAKLLAKHISDASGIRCLHLFEQPVSKDQRLLNKKERFENAMRSIHLKEDTKQIKLPESILIIDDVYTTGSTMFAASIALKNAGAKHIHVLCCARGMDVR